MSNIVSIKQATMTSLELVEYINSERGADESELRHDHFMQKVPKVLGDQAPKFSGTSFYINGAGNKVPRAIYVFPKREACLMAMSYSYDLQAKVFDKMTALEQQATNPAFKIPQTMAEALRLAADQQEQIEVQQLQIKRAAPKVELVDNFLYAGNGKTGEVVAKELAKEFDIGRNRMYAFLQDQGVFNTRNVPRQCHIDAGRFYLQPTTYETEHGRHQSTSVRFTAKGEFHVRALLQKEGYAKRIAA